MDKNKFAKRFYIATLILALGLFILGRYALPKDILSEVDYARYSNLILFGIFGFVLPIGIMVREILIIPYVKKIMITKIIVFILVVIVGVSLFFLVPTVTVSSVVLYLSYGSLIFILVPSNTYRKSSQE